MNETNNMLIEKLGGRKVVMALIGIIIGLVVTVSKGDIPANFLTLLQFVVGAFVAGNAVEHGAAAFSERAVQPVIDPSVFEELKKLGEANLQAQGVSQNGLAMVVDMLNNMKGRQSNG